MLANDDCVGLLPTGGGKSITYQLPALLSEGLTIVISPLIALMSDQVQNLRKKHINAVMINSSMTHTQIDATLDNCIFGDVKILYIAPERIDTYIFRSRLKKMNVSLLAVDEAHCISEWGHDFRPSYLRIGEIREVLPDVPILALTATATDMVLQDIVHFLRLSKPKIFRTSFSRPNIRFVVRNSLGKYEQMMRIISKIDGCGIIYCRTRKATETVADFLKSQGISVEFYHAGLNSKLRAVRQRDWTQGDTRIIVATTAFGMGIDKADVRFVIHYGVPESIEAYYQEAGRAGRDGLPSWAVMLYEPQDQQSIMQRIAVEYPPLAEIRKVYEKLFNFYSIAIGDGKDTLKDFSLMEFSAYAKVYSLTAHAALRILDLAGYIALTEEVDNPTRITFRVNRDDLYRYQNNGSAVNTVLQTILRSYTGLFVDFVAIDEKYISSVAEVGEHDVVQSLIELSRDKIIRYIPRRRTPLIAFLYERLQTKELYIPNKIYSQRKQRSELKARYVIDYAEQTKRCRQVIIQEYFDEKNPKSCGICDLCLSWQQDKTQQSELSEKIEQQILRALNSGRRYDLNRLVDELKCPINVALNGVRALMSRAVIWQEADGEIKIKKGEAMHK